MSQMAVSLNSKYIVKVKFKVQSKLEEKCKILGVIMTFCVTPLFDLEILGVLNASI